MSKNIKVCPGCGEASDAGKKFCPHCGTKMPEETLAQSSVCPSCGKQNNVGTKFCSDCGTKLPSAVQEENAAAAREAAVMEEWDQCLAAYPKWCCGGKDFHIEYYDSDVMFCATFPTNFAAQTAVKQYREVLQQNGFRPAWQANTRISATFTRKSTEIAIMWIPSTASMETATAPASISVSASLPADMIT